MLSITLWVNMLRVCVLSIALWVNVMVYSLSIGLWVNVLWGLCVVNYTLA